MAYLRRDPSGNFHVRFRFNGKQYRRSLKTKHERKAQATACHVEENIRLVMSGRLELPEEVDIPTFLMSDGRVHKKQSTIKAAIHLRDLLKLHREEMPTDALEANPLKLMGTHMRHICRIPGESTTLQTTTWAVLHGVLPVFEISGRIERYGATQSNFLVRANSQDLCSLRSDCVKCRR